MTFATTLALLGFIAGAIVAQPTQTTQATRAGPALRVYSLGKRVADFPPIEDLSTPEAAYATIGRILADGQEAAWRRISVTGIADRLPPADAATRKTSPDESQAWLNAKIVEVRVFREACAGVIARFISPSGAVSINVRFLQREGGKWRNANAGQKVVSSIDEARRTFAIMCGRCADKPPRLKIDDPVAYLARFVEFLGTKGEAPRQLVLNALSRHDIVILGEVHHRPLYWAFNSSLIRDPAFSRSVGTVYMELPSNAQGLVDEFLAAKMLDTQPVIEMLRDNLWMGWPDQAMLDFFVTVWKANQSLPPAQRIRIVLVDMQRPWKDIRTRADWRKYDTDRDRLMADNIVNDLRGQRPDRRHALFIVGVAHAMLDLKYPDETTSIDSAGRRLRQELGADAVYAVFPHMPVQTNAGKRGILANSLPFVGFRDQRCADLIHGLAKQLPPFAVAAQQRRRIAVEPGPPLEVGTRGIEPFQMLGQAVGDTLR